MNLLKEAVGRVHDVSERDEVRMGSEGEITE